MIASTTPGRRAATAAGAVPGVNCTKVVKAWTIPEVIPGFSFCSVAKESRAENWSNEPGGGWADDAGDLAIEALVDADHLSHGIALPEETAGQGLGQHQGVWAFQGRPGGTSQKRKAEDAKDAGVRGQHFLRDPLPRARPEQCSVCSR